MGGEALCCSVSRCSNCIYVCILSLEVVALFSLALLLSRLYCVKDRKMRLW